MNEFGQLLQGYYAENKEYPSRLEIIIPFESLKVMEAPFNAELQYESLNEKTFRLYELNPRRINLFEKKKLIITNSQPQISSNMLPGKLN